MRRTLVAITIATSWLVIVASEQFEDSVFGFGAEDDEDNNVYYPLRTRLDNPFLTSDGGINSKTTRQDPEDVEMFLNPGPMMAPDIILKRYVDSRVSLTSGFDIPEMPRDTESMNKVEVDQAMADDISSYESDINFDEGLLGQSEIHLNGSFINDDDNAIGDNPPGKRCHQKFTGAVGSFRMGFDKNCLIQISNPDPGSRLILTCSPIPLADCSTHKDALAINLVGDMNFKQNSFLYCGHDANIRAISIQNQLAIRIKGTNKVSGTTFCTFHSRKYREYDPNAPSVQCGRLGRLGKIVGGRSVPPGLFPWAVQLDITRKDGSQTGCTGTIVSPHHILTAAHCMKRSESVSAFMGGTDRYDIIGTEVLIQAEKYILHRKWSSRTLVADIALVKLTQPIEYTDDISPICLPEGKLVSEDMSGKRGVALGWGRTETKKKAPRRLYRVKLPLLSDNSCRNIYRRFYIPKVMMCTDSKKDAAICYGMIRI